VDILAMLQENGVEVLTSGHKHCRSGWANMACPFCTGNPGYHLGVTLDKPHHFVCWRCGSKPYYLALSKVLKCSIDKAKEINRAYLGTVSKSPERKRAIRTKAHKLPTDTGPMEQRHHRYLQKRGFDSEFLEHEWQLLGTGPCSKQDFASYAHRILAPIFWEGKQVSFQARDITNKSDTKYKACAIDRELIHHKHILYCHPELDWNEVVIVVEGITDAWRLGRQAAATFGIAFTPEQVRALSQKLKKGGRRAVVLFDDDPQAITQADKLVAELQFRSIDCKKHIIEGDPGGMDQSEVPSLLDFLTNRIWL
jgi:hypothetical protein